MRRNPKIVALGPGAAQAAGLVPNLFTLEEASAVLEEAPQFLARHGLTLEELGPAVLGTGLYAKVFTLPDRRVLKLTTDRDDAEASELIRKAGKVAGLVRVFEVRRFRRPVTERTLDLQTRRVVERQSAVMYGVIEERVQPLNELPNVSRIERKEVSVGPAIYAAQLARKWFVELVDRGARWGQRELTAIEGSMNRTIPDSTVETIAVQMVRELATGWRWLQHSGYEVTDLHAGNFGLIGTRLVIFDFGNDSSVGTGEQPPIEIAANKGSNMGVRMVRVARIFDECFDGLCEQFEDFGELGLKEDERAGEDNGAGADRQFGYCADGDPIVIAFAAKTEQLDERQIRGLMRHEFGHALEYRYGVSELEQRLGKTLPKTIERRADVIAELVWGDPIEYGDRDIQCIGCGGQSPRPSHLQKNTSPAEHNAALQLAKMLKKAGSTREAAASRIQERYELSDAELGGLLRAVWGPEQASKKLATSPEVEEIADRIYRTTIEGQSRDDAMFALLEKSMDIQLGRHKKKYNVPQELRAQVSCRLQQLADEMATKRLP